MLISKRVSLIKFNIGKGENEGRERKSLGRTEK